MDSVTIRKLLSPNDAGETRSNQAGMLVPKRQEILDFFPRLDPRDYNPRQRILFEDRSGQKWHFSFIYYNSRLHKTGTRNEYRLTGMTRFIRESGLKSGDALLLTRRGDDYEVRPERVDAQVSGTGKIRLALTSDWMIIEE
jgi:hypothetical protein